MSQKNQTELSEAVHFLKLTLPEMSKRSIPTTPQNYAVWYEYVAGNNPALRKSIDSLINANRTFTQETNDNLYNKFINGKDSSAIDKIRLEVRKIIDDLLGKVSTEQEDLDHYLSSLTQISGVMENHQDTESIKILVGELVSHTRKQEESSKIMQNALVAMSSEVQKLRLEIEKLNIAASTDPLTRAANRSAFDAELAIATKHSKFEGTPLCLLILDIDHFKKFNDEFGHLTGDKVLKFVAAIIKKNTKGQDTVARFGGEEFAVVLPETCYEDAKSVAENIRQRISSQNLTDSMENRKLGKITISIGVSLFRQNEGIDNFVHRADECLYAAKRAGRDRVIGERDINTEF
ncbi:MAG: GGDEF domain-containing protein [Hahellaceae bacterium]|nr:GGDEF domain-containing protein [Hahellaceae bacterium]